MKKENQTPIKLICLFNVSMLDTAETRLGCFPYFKELSPAEALNLLENNSFQSYVGKPELAHFIEQQLGVVEGSIEVRFERTKILKGDRAIVAQYQGDRYAPEDKRMPKGGTVRFYLIEMP